MKYRSIEEFAKKLHPGEPWFIIRAQDKFAPAAIQSYATISRHHKNIHPIMEAFKQWQKDNPDKVKIPD